MARPLPYQLTEDSPQRAWEETMRRATLTAALAAILGAALTGSAQSVIWVPADQPTIQAGIDAAIAGDTILVADGTYTGPSNRDLRFYGKAITLRSEHGPDATVIDCQSAGRGLVLIDGEGNDTVIEGFTITNGRATGTNTGGGVYLNESAPTFRNCVFTHCISEYYGGGMAAAGALTDPVVVERCTFFANGAYRRGGGLYAGGKVRLVGSQFIANEATGTGGVPADGGGAYFAAPGSEVLGCVFSVNNARRGGGVVVDSTVDMFNCLFEDNAAGIIGGTANRGGAIYATGGNGLWEFLTLVGNLAVDEGDSIYVGEAAQVRLYTSIVWDSPDNGIVIDTGTVQNAWHNDIWQVTGVFPGSGNFNSDPGFVAGPEGRNYLSQTVAGQAQNSPCVGAGVYISSFHCDSGTPALPCLDQMTTRTDEACDAGVVDIGFHYGVTALFRDGFESNGTSRWGAVIP
jgi:predicted outer membrane repeat protein